MIFAHSLTTARYNRILAATALLFALFVTGRLNAQTSREWICGSDTNAPNVPGTRTGQSTTVDRSGNLWIFGGYGLDGSGKFGLLDDLWKYNPATG